MPDIYSVISTPTRLNYNSLLFYADPLEFQSVVVVPKNFTSSENGFSSLIGSGFCHPGFSQSQRWNDRILKYFEQKVMNNLCRADKTVTENEIINLKDFFKKACRPGQWVSDKKFDEELSKDIGFNSIYRSARILCRWFVYSHFREQVSRIVRTMR